MWPKDTKQGTFMSAQARTSSHTRNKSFVDNHRASSYALRLHLYTRIVQTVAFVFVVVVTICAVATCRAARCVGAFALAVAPAVVFQALVHV